MKQLIIAIVILVLTGTGASLKAQEVISSDKDSILITVFLKHQQDKNLDSLQKIQAGDLRTLNMSIEKGAWGAFKTEFYPTYDYVPVWKESMKNSPVTSPHK